MSQRNKNLGELGEQMAVDFLVDKKFKIIEQNHRQKWGEIDIIAKKSGCYHFVEVKTIRTNFDYLYGITPEDQITYRKMLSLKKSALAYANYNKIDDWQIDLIAIEIDSQDKKTIRYWENI